MTSFEHAILAVNGCLATGIDRRWGWDLVCVAALSAVVPDWDGLSLFVGASWFDASHRVWGHNLAAAVIVGAFLGWVDYRWRWISRPFHWLLPRLSVDLSESRWRSELAGSALSVWMGVGAAAALSHLAGDLLFSGGQGLSHWELKLVWPFSDRGWVYPLVPWGDAGISVIFAVGMLAMLRWRSRLAVIAQLTLAITLTYILARGWIVAS